MHISVVNFVSQCIDRMDPERVLEELLALEDSSASSEISLPPANALECKLLSSDNDGSEIQSDSEHHACEGTSFSGTGAQDYYNASSANDDEKVWQEFATVEGKPFLQESSPACLNLALQLNVDWFQPFKHTVFSVGAIYVSILNLPRHMQYKVGNTILILFMQWQSTDILNPVTGYTEMLSQPAGNKWQRTWPTQHCTAAKKSKQLCMHIRETISYYRLQPLIALLHLCIIYSSMTEGRSTLSTRLRSGHGSHLALTTCLRKTQMGKI